RYAEAFADGTADGRFALVIGVNGFDRKVTDQQIRDAVGRIRDRPLPFPVSAVGFTWHNSAIKDGQGPDQRTIPYAAIRETIVRHPDAEQALSDLVGQSDEAPAFIHTGDADVQSMSGLFNRTDAILQDDETIELLSGGYRFGAGTDATADTANQRDLAVREAMSRVVPRTVYLPEPNTLVRVTSPMTRLQNEVTFGVRTDPTSSALKYTSMEGRGLAESVISSRGRNDDARGAVVFDKTLAVTTESDRLLQNYDPAERDAIPQSHADKKVWREQVDRYLLQQHPGVYKNDWAAALADLAFRSVDPPTAKRQTEILGSRKKLKESVDADEFKSLMDLAQETDKALEALPYAENVQTPSHAPRAKKPDAAPVVTGLVDAWSDAEDAAPTRRVSGWRTDLDTVFLAPGQVDLDTAPSDGARPVRVVTSIPTGDAGERLMDRLRQRAVQEGRQLFVPAPGHRVIVEGADLVVRDPADQPGRWVALGEFEQAGHGVYRTTPAGRLARDVTDPNVQVTAGELVAHQAEKSVLGPGSVWPEIGETARTLGIEAEFDLPAHLSASEATERRRRILADLRSFGLTRQTEVGGIKAAHLAGSYSSARSGWSVELDRSVTGGEIVSPILPYADPESPPDGWPGIWWDVALVLAVVERHGGHSSPNTGGQVHLGVGDFARRVDLVHRLVDEVRSREDALFRLSATPGARYSRGIRYSEPLKDQREDYLPDEAAWPDFGFPLEHESIVSFTQLANDHRDGKAAATDHIEFRSFDGSLDLGVVRVIADLGRALADATIDPQRPVPAQPHPMGEAFLTGEGDQNGTERDNAALASLLDLLPPEAVAQRERITALWGRTRWLPPLTGLSRTAGQFIHTNTTLSGRAATQAWTDFDAVAAGFPEQTVVLHITPHHPNWDELDGDTQAAELDSLLEGWSKPADPLDAESSRELSLPATVIVVDDGSQHETLDDQVRRFGHTLIRPVPGGRAVVETAVADGASGWHSDRGWELAGRDSAGDVTAVPLGEFFGPQRFRQILAGELAPVLTTPPVSPNAVHVELVPGNAVAVTGALHEQVLEFSPDGTGRLTTGDLVTRLSDDNYPGAVAVLALGTDEERNLEYGRAVQTEIVGRLRAGRHAPAGLVIGSSSPGSAPKWRAMLPEQGKFAAATDDLPTAVDTARRHGLAPVDLERELRRWANGENDPYGFDTALLDRFLTEPQWRGEPVPRVLRVPVRAGASEAEQLLDVRRWLRTGVVRRLPAPGEPAVAVTIDVDWLGAAAEGVPAGAVVSLPASIDGPATTLLVLSASHDNDLWTENYTDGLRATSLDVPVAKARRLEIPTDAVHRILSVNQAISNEEEVHGHPAWSVISFEKDRDRWFTVGDLADELSARSADGRPPVVLLNSLLTYDWRGDDYTVMPWHQTPFLRELAQRAVVVALAEDTDNPGTTITEVWYEGTLDGVVYSGDQLKQRLITLEHQDRLLMVTGGPRPGTFAGTAHSAPAELAAGSGMPLDPGQTEVARRLFDLAPRPATASVSLPLPVSTQPGEPAGRAAVIEAARSLVHGPEMFVVRADQPFAVLIEVPARYVRPVAVEGGTVFIVDSLGLAAAPDAELRLPGDDGATPVRSLRAPTRPEPPAQNDPRSTGRRPERVAEPVLAAEIAALRETVLPRTANTVSFDVVELAPITSGIPDVVADSYRRAGLPAPETNRPRLNLGHVDGSVAYDHRLLTTADGRTVQDFTVRIHLDPQDLDAVTAAEETQQRARAAVDTAFNQAFRIGDDQFHVTVEFTDDPSTAHTTITLVTTDTPADQHLWSTRSGDLTLAHEVGHYLGLTDEYPDRQRVLQGQGVTDDSLMATVQIDHNPRILDRHLDRITTVQEGALGPETRPSFDTPAEAEQTFPGPPRGGLSDPLATPKPRRRLENGVWIFPPPTGARAFMAAASSITVPEGAVVIAAALPPGRGLELVSSRATDHPVNAVAELEQIADGADTVVFYLHGANLKRSTRFAVDLREVLDSHVTRLALRRIDLPEPHTDERPGQMPAGLVVSAPSSFLSGAQPASRWLVSMPGSTRLFGPVGDLTLAVQQAQGSLLRLDLPAVLRYRLAGGLPPQGIDDDDLAELALREAQTTPAYSPSQPADEPDGPLGDLLLVPADPAWTSAELLSALRRSVRLGTVGVWPGPETNS
ncbi:MAG TPA: hypothetical protein VFG35_05875, partial [Actinoplanes sp.]|nr:hypothetical protein [Actinoplanes sp.]